MTLKFFLALISTSIKASMSLRGAFLLEAFFLLTNNLIFFVLWIIFFRQFNEIGGWTLPDVIALMAICTGAWGFMNIFFGGVRELAQSIVSGQLDPLMSQPKNLLIHLISSRSLAKGWGHILTTIVLVIFGGLLHCQCVVLVTVGVVMGGLVFTAAGVIVHSLAFWLGPIESISKRYHDSLFLFALYPTNIYSGFVQVVMFTLMPAGIIGFLPVELIKEFSWERLFILCTSTLAFCTIAFQVFNAGLKRYESGNQFTIR